jgi:hypothetical protein
MAELALALSLSLCSASRSSEGKHCSEAHPYASPMGVIGCQLSDTVNRSNVLTALVVLGVAVVAPGVHVDVAVRG